MDFLMRESSFICIYPKFMGTTKLPNEKCSEILIFTNIRRISNFTEVTPRVI